MKLISFYKGKNLRAGAAVEGYAIDLEKAAKALGCGVVPDSIRAILEGGEPALGRVRRAVRRAEARMNRVAAKKDRRPVWAMPLGDVELAPPVPNPEKIICVGQNYIDHCREQGVDPPASPIIFTKFPTSLTGAASPIKIPPETVTRAVDFEVELAFVIGREGKRIAKRNAMSHVAGYTVMNDVTARDIQKSDGQWVRAKSIDTFGPCGPWLVTRDEIDDPHDLRIWLKVNGETMQDSSTKNLIFKIPQLLEFLSRTITFRPGDIVATGTPPGVGIFRSPPVLLGPGDVVEAGIDGIGTIQNRCTRDRG